MLSLPAIASALALVLASLPYAAAQGSPNATPGPGKFFFQWPTQVTQCQVVNLTWGAGAVAPFQAWVVPIGQQPFIYNIPASAYRNGFGSYQIQVQLNQGQNYVLLVSDSRGIGTGGTSALQIVGSSPQTSCLNTAAQNQTQKQFSYSVSGRAEQCRAGFELQWDGSAENAPYNFTVIPLLQSYYPFDVTIDERTGYSSDWLLNMTAGTRFTVVMNNKNAYGTGGAAGIYEVANSTTGGTRCIAQSVMGTASWPVGVATNTLPVATNPPQTPRGSGGITGGAIAGIVIGVLAALGLLGLMVWFLLRRKRRREQQEAGDGKGTELDLADSNSNEGGNEGGYRNDQVTPIVSPFPTYAESSAGQYQPLSARDRDRDRDRYSPSDGGRDEVEMTESGTYTSAGVAGFGAGVAAGSSAGAPWLSNRDSRTTLERREEREAPGVAGPLPSKSPSYAHPPSSRQNALPPLPTDVSGGTGDQPGWKRDHLSLPPGAGFHPGPSGGMRVVNHDHPEDLPALGAGTATGDGAHRERDRDRERRRESRLNEERRMQFRRHEDAGRVDIVDLPPLYTDVPRDTARTDEQEQEDERTPLSPGSGLDTPPGTDGSPGVEADRGAGTWRNDRAGLSR